MNGLLVGWLFSILFCFVFACLHSLVRLLSVCFVAGYKRCRKNSSDDSKLALSVPFRVHWLVLRAR